jgi:ABC-type branched-subunit amino acid transport system substrate-binding protein
MFRLLQAEKPARLRRGRRGALVAGLAAFLSACSGGMPDIFNNSPSSSPPAADQPTQGAIGAGHVKIGLLLPLSGSGNAGAAGQSMRNAAELALSEFNNPNIQLLVKDDGGSAQGAQQATQQALDEGAEIILGPLFAASVSQAGVVAHSRGVPLIAFSTDANVAGRGVYLLSFLPESDVDRIIEYAIAQGRKSFVALIPDNAYGSVVEAEFKQVVSRKGARVVALERYPADGGGRIADAARQIAQAASRADAIFIPDSGEGVAAAAQALAGAGLNLKRLQALGTGLWDDPRIFQDPATEGGWYPAPDSAGFRAFSTRYRAKYGQEPVRTATLAYDAVALVAALVKTQGAKRFATETLTNGSGFAGIDGVFRFRPDGTNQRGLAVLKATPSGGQVISPAPRTFGGSGT